MKRILLVFFSSILVFLCGCSSYPESPFEGEWDSGVAGSHGEIPYMRMTILPGKWIEKKRVFGDNLMRRRIDIDTIRESIEKNGKVAVRAGNEVLVFEKKSDGNVEVREYNAKVSLERALSQNPPAAEDTFVLFPKKKDMDYRFKNLEPVHYLYGKKWYEEAAPENALFDFDEKTGNLKLYDNDYINQNEGKADLPLIHYEEFQTGDHIDGSWYDYPNSIRVTFYPRPDATEGSIFVDTGRAMHAALVKRVAADTSNAHKKAYSQFERNLAPYYEWATSELETRNKAREEREKKEREEEEKKAQEEQRIREAKIAAAQKLIDEKRAKLSTFSFYGISLSDTPQMVVQKLLPDFFIATTFPVNQSSDTIREESLSHEGWAFLYTLTPKYMEDVCKREIKTDKMLETFSGAYDFTTRLNSIDLYPPKRALEEGVRLDSIDMVEKASNNEGRTKIHVSYFTLPGEQPEMLFLTSSGTIVPEAIDVFRERYGEPEIDVTEQGKNRELLWRSQTEMAYTLEYFYNYRLAYASLTLISLKALDKYDEFVNKAAEREKAAQELKRKEEEERKKAEENLRKSKI